VQNGRLPGSGLYPASQQPEQSDGSPLVQSGLLPLKGDVLTRVHADPPSACRPRSAANTGSRNSPANRLKCASIRFPWRRSTDSLPPGRCSTCSSRRPHNRITGHACRARSCTDRRSSEAWRVRRETLEVGSRRFHRPPPADRIASCTRSVFTGDSACEFPNLTPCRAWWRWRSTATSSTGSLCSSDGPENDYSRNGLQHPGRRFLPDCVCHLRGVGPDGRNRERRWGWWGAGLAQGNHWF